MPACSTHGTERVKLFSCIY